MLLKVLIFSVLISFDNASNIEVYEDALSQVKISSEYVNLSKKKHKYYVSHELISFHAMGWFFKKELHGHVEVTEENFISKSVAVSSKNHDLLQLGTNKYAELKVYFSEINEGIFFCEILESPKKNIKYEDRPHFGRSFAFMFKIENDEVHLLSTKEIAYN